MRRTKEEARQTREDLLNAALRVFSNKGYAAAKLEDIAKAAGVTRGAVYWHFGGKAQLFHALVRERFTKINDVLSQTFTLGGSPFERLRRVLVQSLQLVEEEPEYRSILELTMFKMERTPELEAGLREKMEAAWAFQDTITGLIRSGIRQGDFRKDVSPNHASFTAVAFMNGAIMMWLAAPDDFSLTEEAEIMVDTFLGGIRA